ncbi:hypothetical protein ASPWEDRAFT_150280 [Aspergillus wentii DTO 134E9]|uniref:DUF6594 domain-containing protein n=1 Tax=Aspergillus wentii DTO 134E9 TaxID=1073089 RepID=A0A1L9RWG1_ASPWE|nr:uncharacterized protein ASPWEDRAFT_150280 [Aspergillus wentii DTO 134E9]OJJ39280.1 hypothetical protein ASPWEDRAFT_150280 [Aspergillus wentii DTO 134E9]
MPFQYYGSSSRTRKPKKDSGKRSSTASIISHSSQPPSKGSKTSVERPRKETVPAMPYVEKPSVRPQRKPVEPEKKKTPDVFEFLEGEDDSDSSSSEDDDDSVDIPSSQATSVSKGQSKTTPPPRVSQKASIPSRRSSVMSKDSMDSRLPPTPLDIAQLQLARTNVNNRKTCMDELYVPNGSSTDGSTLSGQELPDFPEAYYSRNPTQLQRHPLPPSPPKSPEGDLHRDHRKPRKTTRSPQSSQTTPSGYGLVASQLSSSVENETRFPPLYRRFETLNHRVLLYLQDEIAQMEEDLQVLDEYEEMHRISNAEHDGTKALPASRRMDAQAQVYSSLHYRRVDLMGALAQKTEQYNTALNAYNKVLRSLPPASEKDIESYRSWMGEKHPIVAAETRFLDHDSDLVSLAPRVTQQSTTAPVYSAIAVAAAAILLPLLAFSMIREFSGRLIIVTIVGGATSAIAGNYSTGAERLVDARDGWRCATVYFVFMTVAAMFIP